jgi:hypothetical protein
LQNIKEYRYLTPFEVLVIHVLLVNWEPDTDYDPFESTTIITAWPTKKVRENNGRELSYVKSKR